MLQSVQICRGLAALLVLVYHTSAIMGLQKYGSQNIFNGYLSSLGFIGVDFFFVLSGFIIPFAHQKDVGRSDQFGRYAYRRVSRIYPIYWLYLTMILIAYQVRGEQSILSFADYFQFLFPFASFWNCHSHTPRRGRFFMRLFFTRCLAY